MKLLFDLFPVLAFFIAYYIPDDLTQRMYVATAVTVVAVILQLSYYWLIHRRFEKMHLITLAIIPRLGRLTLLLQDKRFLRWKPTAMNWSFAIAFPTSEFIDKKPLIQRMMDHAITIPENVWYLLNRSWTGFFIISGSVNLIVAYSFAGDIWVNFKVFEILVMTMLFAIGQAFYLTRHMRELEKTGEKP